MSDIRWQRLAQLAITIQCLALVRTRGEYYRLRYTQGPAYVQGTAFSAAAAEPYVRGGLVAAVGTWIAITCYFLRRYVWTVAAAGGTIVVLLVLRFTLLA